MRLLVKTLYSQPRSDFFVSQIFFSRNRSVEPSGSHPKIFIKEFKMRGPIRDLVRIFEVISQNRSGFEVRIQ